MKKNFCTALSLGFLAAATIFMVSCSKDKAVAAKSEKYQIVTGTWKQSDIVLGVGVSVKVGGTKYDFPAGTSVISDPYFKALGVAALFTDTKTNIYNFTDSGSYRIDGSTSLILPVAGKTGTWVLDVYDAVLKLTTAANVNDPHWISGIKSDSLSLSLTVKLPGLGTAPLNLLLKKQ